MSRLKDISMTQHLKVKNRKKMRQCIILTRRNVGTLLRIRKFFKNGVGEFKVEENGKKMIKMK